MPSFLANTRINHGPHNEKKKYLSNHGVVKKIYRPVRKKKVFVRPVDKLNNHGLIKILKFMCIWFCFCSLSCNIAIRRSKSWNWVLVTTVSFSLDPFYLRYVLWVDLHDPWRQELSHYCLKSLGDKSKLRF
jgi:hypothetical protein